MRSCETPGSGPGAFCLACARLAGFLALVGMMIPVQVIYTAFRPHDAFRLPLLFHRCLLRLIGLQVRVHDVMTKTWPVLFVANHSSYLDIPVLGAIIPAAFVAKADVAHWPLFGLMAKLQKTVFIERRATSTRQHRDGMRARFEKGQSLILFPEGTSSDGLHVLPFRSGLFGSVEKPIGDKPILVQPLSITCSQLDGLPITRAWRPYYAWFGDMTLVGHLWNVFRIGGFTVDVVFHPAVSPAGFADRKALAAWCWHQVAAGVEQCLTGRAFQPALPKATAPPQDALAGASQG